MIRKLVYSITNRHNAKQGDYNVWEQKPVNEMTLSEIERFSKTNSGRFSWLDISGGDATLRQDYIDIVNTFRRNNDIMFFSTTIDNLLDAGYYVDKMEELARMGMRYTYAVISLSPPGGSEGKLQGMEGHFSKAIALASQLRSIELKYGNFHFLFGYTITQINQGLLIPTIEATRHMLPFVNYKRFLVDCYQRSSIYSKDDTQDLTPDTKIAIPEMIKYRSLYGLPLSIPEMIRAMYLKGLVYFMRRGERLFDEKPFRRFACLDNYGNLYPSLDIGSVAENIRHYGGIYDLSALEKQPAEDKKEPIAVCNDSVQFLDVPNFIKAAIIP